MKVTHVSEVKLWLRSNTNRVEEMLKHFDTYRVVAGSGIKDGSCCAASLSPGKNYVFGNSQASKLDKDAFDAGKGHAEVVAFDLSEARHGDWPRRLFCELSPCPACRIYFDGTDVEIIYLFQYPRDLNEWKAFHNESLPDQVSYFRQQAGLDP